MPYQSGQGSGRSARWSALSERDLPVWKSEWTTDFTAKTNLSFTCTVPEPATWPLLALAATGRGLMVVRRREPLADPTARAV